MPISVSMPRPLLRPVAALILSVLAAMLMGLTTNPAQAQILSTAATEGGPAQDNAAATGGPVRLRQAAEASQPTGAAQAFETRDRPAELLAPYVPGEFERFVQSHAGPGAEVRRFGAELISGGFDGRASESSPLVPTDYLIAPGDEVLLTLWGSVDADLRLIVDRGGRISVPRVGTIQVAGVRHADLQDVVSRRVGQLFKNFQLSVTLGQLRGIRVLVTGFVQRPGSYTVTSLSTVVTALMRAGGPGSSGSFRVIDLRRDGQQVATFDLYDLLLKGDRSADRVLQAGDVIHVGPVGVQAGFVGSVNKAVVLELKAGETVADALRIAGGFSAVADRNRLAIERLQDRNGARVVQLDLPAGLTQAVHHGDVLRAFSAVDIALPVQRQSKRVRVEGEVQRPAEYVLPEGSSLADALRAAGGFTPSAHVFATEFSRESVRRTQQENYERALRDLETNFARASSSRRIASADEAAGETVRSSSTSRLLERLRTLRPNGRIVLQMAPDSQTLPDLALEDRDRIYVPARATTVGVFGSVFNAASYLFSPGRNLDDYLRLAGGPTRGADQTSVFVVRANGNVVSNQQDSSWFKRSSAVGELLAEPGDTVFVPEELNKSTFVQSAKDWTQILYQLGIGIAGIKSAVK